MIAYTFAHRIDRVKSILAGMAAYADKLGKWGITPDFIVKINKLYNRANEIEQQKNATKALSQQLTVEQEQVMSELEGNCGLVKKLVRFELPKESWPEFGFRKGEHAVKKSGETEDQESTQ